MLIEILCTGDEILTGKTVNTNHSHIARRLGEVGLTMDWCTVVGDDRNNLQMAFKQASARANAVIVNGGLGPTVDDLSQEVAAETAGVELLLHDAWLDRMLAFYEQRGRTMPPNNKKQAMLPEGAEFIDNPVGTACGFAIDIGKARFFFTPGVPREMRRMMDEQIIPRLLEMKGTTTLTRLKRFHSFGIGESRADNMLHDIETGANKNALKLGFQAHYPQLETKLIAQAKTENELEKILEPAATIVRKRLGNFIISEDEQTIEGVILEELRKRKATLATAEMFTSGAIATRLNPAPNNEDPILRNLVSRSLLQLCQAVNLRNLPDYSACTPQVAIRIAKSLKNECNATYALATLIELDADTEQIESGGNIHIGLATPKGTFSRHARMLGGNEWIRLGATDLTLDVFRRYLQKLPIEERIDFEKR
tara:strand:+ start:739 stop:2010 length:1272 start_codon:yes stop_codon:yes gene_type:complete